MLSALAHRDAIDQAVGVLVETRACDAAIEREALDEAATGRNVTVHAAAVEVLARYR
jgi:hypothetical protein